MGGGAVPTPVTTAGVNYHLQPLRSPTFSPFSSNFSTGGSDFLDENQRTAIGYSNRTNFGPAPSQIEVQNAISDLRRVMNGFGEIMEQCNYDDSRTAMKSLGQKRLFDAYHLLQTDPLVQRLVRSISSDTQVWDAILKNDAVQDLPGLLSLTETEEECTTYKPEPEPISTSAIVKWIFAVMKSKLVDLMEKLEVFVFEMLHSVSKKTSKPDDDLLEEKVRSSLLLSIVILVIVVVSRSIET